MSQRKKSNSGDASAEQTDGPPKMKSATEVKKVRNPSLTALVLTVALCDEPCATVGRDHVGEDRSEGGDRDGAPAAFAMGCLLLLLTSVCVRAYVCAACACCPVMPQVMMLAFMAIMYAGHLYVAAMVVMIQVGGRRFTGLTPLLSLVFLNPA